MQAFDCGCGDVGQAIGFGKHFAGLRPKVIREAQRSRGKVGQISAVTFSMNRFLFVLLALASVALPVHADTVKGASYRLVEPGLKLSAHQGVAPRVALTLDACSGKIDHRILDMLVKERIAATIFVTARWLKRNDEAVAIFKAHPDLFELEDHGREHLAPIDRPTTVYGVHSAGSPEALALEVGGGADAMRLAGLDAPHWYRGATAKYSASAIELIEGMGYRVAGFSLNADGGSLLGAKTTGRRIAAARDGDVIIAHINQPGHAAGKGVVSGVLALKKRGFEFVLLRDAAEPVASTVHSSALEK
jgi:peptidoglycan/xylan/chitin deacetylase (PgdA/CDA1 family)